MEYKVEYLDVVPGGEEGEEAPEEEQSYAWIARAGKARVTYANGSTYVGDFNEEKQKDGQGIFTWMVQPEEEEEEAKVLAVYEGSYKDGKRSGEGKMTYPNGDVYQGEWKVGKMHGKGTYKYSNGDLYSGEFKEGLKDGQGIYEYGVDLSRLDGVWESGQFKSGNRRFKDAGTYQGTFENGQPKGPGTFYFNTACGTVSIKQQGEYKAQEQQDASEEGETKPDDVPQPVVWFGQKAAVQ